MKKRLCAGLLSLILILSLGAFPAAVYAENAVEWNYPVEHLSAHRGYDSLKDAVDLKSLESYLFEQFRTCTDSFDISSFGLSREFETDLFNYIWKEMYGAFHVYALGCRIDGNGTITTLRATYKYDAATYNEMYEKCLDAADELLGGIRYNSALTEVEKALLIHDRLAVHCEYAYDELLSGSLLPENYTIYGALVGRRAVCQGYAEAYAFLLDMVGIESYICESDALNHAWNIVYIGGKPFHVDVTWDDPVRDVNGRVNHANFLRSNSGIVASGHDAADYDAPAVYDDYENASWLDNTSEYVLLGGEIYYIATVGKSREASLTRLSDGKALADLTETWSAGGNSYWLGNYSRLATDGKYLYYNSSKAFYRFDPETNTAEIVFEPDLSADEGYSIYGMRYESGKLIYDIWTKPNFDASTPTDLEYELTMVFIKGDINGNGRIDANDYALVKRHWLGSYTIRGGAFDAADINGNGRIDVFDYYLIKRHVLGTYVI